MDDVLIALFLLSVEIIRTLVVVRNLKFMLVRRSSENELNQSNHNNLFRWRSDESPGSSGIKLNSTAFGKQDVERLQDVFQPVKWM